MLKEWRGFVVRRRQWEPGLGNFLSIWQGILRVICIQMRSVETEGLFLEVGSLQVLNHPRIPVPKARPVSSDFERVDA